MFREGRDGKNRGGDVVVKCPLKRPRAPWMMKHQRRVVFLAVTRQEEREGDRFISPFRDDKSKRGILSD